MHEATVAASLIRIVERAAQGLGNARVIRIELSIGRLKAIEPCLLISCFGFMAEDTICAGAEVICREVPITVLCADCAETQAIPGYQFRCPTCDGNNLTIKGGGELRVDRIFAR